MKNFVFFTDEKEAEEFAEHVEGTVEKVHRGMGKCIVYKVSYYVD